MFNQIKKARGSEEGFTLIELLVVIVILGILAAVVVFAVSGLSDKGNTSACKIDTRTLRTAEEAYYANGSTPANAYTANQSDLVDGGFLAEASTLHSVAIPGLDPDGAGTRPAAPYGVKITQVGEDKGCGNVGEFVGEAAGDI